MIEAFDSPVVDVGSLIKRSLGPLYSLSISQVKRPFLSSIQPWQYVLWGMPDWCTPIQIWNVFSSLVDIQSNYNLGTSGAWCLAFFIFLITEQKEGAWFVPCPLMSLFGWIPSFWLHAWSTPNDFSRWWLNLMWHALSRFPEGIFV
jgi:hypothetical protein